MNEKRDQAPPQPDNTRTAKSQTAISQTVTTEPKELITATPSWLSKLDAWSGRIADQLNPILIKETRQSLKSRQFVYTFFALLVAAFAWTVAGSFSRMPQIYTTPSAPILMLGYFAVLAIPMLLVVPLAAYRSLEVEIDDGTLELLSISTLSPWQIILGKLASSLLQILLYFVVLLPCMAYAYTLRGVDLLEMTLVAASLLASAVMLTVIAIFFAPMSHSRTGRTLTLLLTVVMLFAAVAGVSVAITLLIRNGNPLRDKELFFVIASVVSIGGTLGHLLLTCAAAQLTPESENRSTRLRWSVLGLSTALIFSTALATTNLNYYVRGQGVVIPQQSTLYFLIISTWALWTFAGAMFVSESANLTPRIRRELPRSIVSRTLNTWFTPGHTTGFIFVCINVAGLFIWFSHGLRWLSGQTLEPTHFTIIQKDFDVINSLSVVFASYLIITLILVRWLMIAIRRKQNPRIEVGMAALLAITILMVLIPYSVGSQLNNFQPFDYSEWQMTNWFWTLSWIYQGNDPGHTPLMVETIASLGLLLTLVANSKVTRAQRTAMPSRVLEEQKSLHPTEIEIDVLAEDLHED